MDSPLCMGCKEGPDACMECLIGQHRALSREQED